MRKGHLLCFRRPFVCALVGSRCCDMTCDSLTTVVAFGIALSFLIPQLHNLRLGRLMCYQKCIYMENEGRTHLSSFLYQPRSEIFSYSRYSVRNKGDMNYLMDVRLEDVTLSSLVEKSVNRNFTSARKLNKK